MGPRLSGSVMVAISVLTPASTCNGKGRRKKMVIGGESLAQRYVKDEGEGGRRVITANDGRSSFSLTPNDEEEERAEGGRKGGWPQWLRDLPFRS